MVVIPLVQWIKLVSKEQENSLSTYEHLNWKSRKMDWKEFENYFQKGNYQKVWKAGERPGAYTIKLYGSKFKYFVQYLNLPIHCVKLASVI